LKVLLIVHDNDSFIHYFPPGLGYIAAILEKNDIQVEVYCQGLHHWPDQHLTQHLDDNYYDAVGITFVGSYYPYKRVKSISTAINRSKNRPFYILGGHGPAPEPEYFLKLTQADAVVIGEGEETVLELLAAVAAHRPLHGIKGIAYREGNTVTVNPRRPLIQDINALPMPAYHLFPMEYYRLLRMPHIENREFCISMITGRGCTFRCNFCYRMDEGFRPRSNESIIAEIMLLKTNYGITYFNFCDELLMSSVKRTESICKDFIKSKLDIRWTCNGRLNYAKSGLLKLMKQAGCVFINYGIESLDDQILRNMKKGLTSSQIIKGIEATYSVGISPGLNIIFGNIGETRETLQKGVDFLLKYDNGAQMRTICPVTPYPGSDLYYYAIEHGLLRDCEDFYENKHRNVDLLTVNFTDMSDNEFHEALFEANSTLLRNYYNNACQKTIDEARKLYLENNTAFRGFRNS
jgi:radical SAM superfamily enzyme YgiQ (UPF0313 family)